MNIKVLQVANLIVIALGLLSFPAAATGQQPQKMHRIGVLLTVPREGELYDAFRARLQQLGYVEGKNVSIEYRNAQGHIDKLPALAAELVRLKVDVILTASTPTAQALQHVTSTIPIVVAVSSDPVGNGLVASLARPGGNITGLTLMLPELSMKRLELLKEVVPKVSRVGVLWNSSNPAFDEPLRLIKQVAPSLGMRLQVLQVRNLDELDQALSATMSGRVDALFVWGEPVTYEHRARILAAAAKRRVPAIYDLRKFAEDGGLIAYGPDVPDLFRRAATYVDEILKGAHPADLPVQQPTTYELVINLKTAKALGLTIPQSLLIRADEVIR